MTSLSSKLRSLPLVISLIALFVALGGPSYAADLINGKRIKNRSISGKKLKANAVGGKAVKESALGQVPSAKRADAATKATTADTASRANLADTAGSATNAAQLGGIPAGDYVRRLFAVYDSSTDSIVRGAGAVSVQPGGGPGVRGIKFNRNVSDCAWIATRGDQAAAGAGSNFVSTELSSSTELDTILVRTRDASDTSYPAVDFHLVVFC